MCYLTIKEMANISEDVIIVTSRFVPQCLMALSITCVQILTSAPGSVFFVLANWKLRSFNATVHHPVTPEFIK